MTYAIFTILLFATAITSAATPIVRPTLVRTVLEKTPDCVLAYPNVFLCGSTAQRTRVMTWVDSLRRTESGEALWSAIRESPHFLLIMHSPRALMSAGKTLTPLSRALDDGRGVEPVIEMHLDMPDGGTHEVGAEDGGWVAFPALVNFVHELVHARHAMHGTMAIAATERQAIEGENVFRVEWAKLMGEIPRRRSYDYEKGREIWSPFGLLLQTWLRLEDHVFVPGSQD